MTIIYLDFDQTGLNFYLNLIQECALEYVFYFTKVLVAFTDFYTKKYKFSKELISHIFGTCVYI